MFTVPKDTELTPELIKQAMDVNEELRPELNRLERYYLGLHEILTREKNGRYKNNKLIVNHAKYITDTNVGYLLGNPVEYQAKEDGYDLSPVLEQYDMQTINDLDHELAKDTSIFGKQYELVYTIENNLISKDVDVRNCIIIYDDTISHEKLFAVIYRMDDRNIPQDIIVYDKDFEYRYVARGSKLELSSITAHWFNMVPVIKYRNNAEEYGDFTHVINLIDAYNLLQSDRVNDKEQLVEAILLIFGFDMDDKQREDLADSRMLVNIPPEARVEFLTKQLDEANADGLRKVLESDIHKISMTPNMSDANFAGDSSGVAIRYKLLAFEQSVSNKERYFEKGLKERFQLYNNYLNKLINMPIIPIHKVDVVFKRNLPQNDLETSQMVNNLKGIVDNTTLLGQISFVKDAQQVEDALAKEQEADLKRQNDMFGTPNPNGQQSAQATQSAQSADQMKQTA